MSSYDLLLRESPWRIVLQEARSWPRKVGRALSIPDESDERLVERSVAGDGGAFSLLVDRHKDRVHWLVRRMLPWTDGDDLTQDVFVRAYQALPRFRGECAFRTWLFKITRNLCLSEIRKRERRGDHLSFEEEGEERVHWSLPERPGLMEEIERRDLAETVKALVQRLPTAQRTAITLFYLEQISYEEIAEIMEIPLGTVKTHIHRGRLRLRELVIGAESLDERNRP